MDTKASPSVGEWGWAWGLPSSPSAKKYLCSPRSGTAGFSLDREPADFLTAASEAPHDLAPVSLFNFVSRPHASSHQPAPQPVVPVWFPFLKCDRLLLPQAVLVRLSETVGHSVQTFPPAGPALSPLSPDVSSQVLPGHLL